MSKPIKTMYCMNSGDKCLCGEHPEHYLLYKMVLLSKHKKSAKVEGK